MDYLPAPLDLVHLGVVWVAIASLLRLKKCPWPKQPATFPWGGGWLLCDSALGEDEVGFLTDPQGGSLRRNDEAERAR